MVSVVSSITILVLGSENSHLNLPYDCISSLKSFQLLTHSLVPVQFQIPIPSSMYLAQNSRSLLPENSALRMSSQIEKYRVAHIQAGGVPMAVPEFCWKYASENWKMLFFIMISMPSNICVGMRCCNSSIAWSVSMLVYMLTASQVKSLAVFVGSLSGVVPDLVLFVSF